MIVLINDQGSRHYLPDGEWKRSMELIQAGYYPWRRNTGTETPLRSLAGISPVMISAIRDAGYTTVEALDKIEDNTLLSIKGIGPAAVRKIRKALNG